MLTCLDDLSAPPPAAGREVDRDGETADDDDDDGGAAETLPAPRGHVVIIGVRKPSLLQGSLP